MKEYNGGLYDRIDFPRTKAEAKKEAEILLGAIQDETQELYDTMEPMEQIWSSTRMQKISDYIMELGLYISMMADTNRA